MSPLEPGLEIVPGLTLLRPLGRGGMGEAWLARDAGRGEEVVAKVLPADAPAGRVALLRREARLVRKLVHPRVVPVYGFQSGERGSVVTARHMKGGDAGRRRGATPLDVVRIGVDVADALAYLHGLGVVHRDVKATNVLLDEHGRAHVADFGIAAVGSGDADDVVVVGGGSRASMSPQQAAGEPARPADDLYALGALIYELLSGQPPVPPVPPVRSPFPVPPELRDLVARLMADAPSERPASAAEARDALVRIEAGLRGGADRLEPAVRLRPPPRLPDGASVLGSGLEARLDRLRERPARSGASPAQVTVLAALAVAAVVALVWLPRWAQPVPAVAPSSPLPSATPAVDAPSPARPPAEATPVVPDEDRPVSATRPPRSLTGAPETIPADSRPPPPTPAPVPTPDRRAEAGALARHRDAARVLEAREEWESAQAEYEAALAVDAHVSFALEGRERARERAILARGLEAHIARPLRLSSDAVAREAEAVLERARGVDAPGPRLRSQIAALESALASARTPVIVVIESDGLTEVAVSRVGRLGTLTRREIELRPGEYSVTGSRRGFRDVRLRLTVTPGAAIRSVVVRCEEAI